MTIEADEFSFDVVVEYYVTGEHRHATFNDPGECPEVEIMSFRIPKELADLFGVDILVDYAAIAKYIDMNDLSEGLIEHFQEINESDFD